MLYCIVSQRVLACLAPLVFLGCLSSCDVCRFFILFFVVRYLCPRERFTICTDSGTAARCVVLYFLVFYVSFSYFYFLFSHFCFVFVLLRRRPSSYRIRSHQSPRRRSSRGYPCPQTFQTQPARHRRAVSLSAELVSSVSRDARTAGAARRGTPGRSQEMQEQAMEALHRPPLRRRCVLGLKRLPLLLCCCVVFFLG